MQVLSIMRLRNRSDRSNDNESSAPKPETYGLDRYSSPTKAADDISRATTDGKIIAGSGCIFWTLPALLGVMAYQTDGSDDFNWVYVGFIAWMIAYLGFVKDEIIERYMKSKVGNQLAYLRAYTEWKDFNSEKGLSYWRNQKGVEFESSIARFFERRGWKTQLTPTVGDGGVDVILQRGTQTLWCQCKGHAKSLSVSEVRRIAGATLKSNGAAKPVLISTNGFTRPALDEAKQLGVICIDAVRLTQMAYKSDLPILA